MAFVQKEKWLIYLTVIYTHSEYVSGEHIRLTIWYEYFCIYFPLSNVEIVF